MGLSIPDLQLATEHHLFQPMEGSIVMSGDGGTSRLASPTTTGGGEGGGGIRSVGSGFPTSVPTAVAAPATTTKQRLVRFPQVPYYSLLNDVTIERQCVFHNVIVDRSIDDAINTRTRSDYDTESSSSCATTSLLSSSSMLSKGFAVGRRLESLLRERCNYYQFGAELYQLGCDGNTKGGTVAAHQSDRGSNNRRVKGHHHSSGAASSHHSSASYVRYIEALVDVHRQFFGHLPTASNNTPHSTIGYYLICQDHTTWKNFSAVVFTEDGKPSVAVYGNSGRLRRHLSSQCTDVGIDAVSVEWINNMLFLQSSMAEVNAVFDALLNLPLYSESHCMTIISPRGFVHGGFRFLALRQRDPIASISVAASGGGSPLLARSTSEGSFELLPSSSSVVMRSYNVKFSVGGTTDSSGANDSTAATAIVILPHMFRALVELVRVRELWCDPSPHSFEGVNSPLGVEIKCSVVGCTAPLSALSYLAWSECASRSIDVFLGTYRQRSDKGVDDNDDNEGDVDEAEFPFIPSNVTVVDSECIIAMEQKSSNLQQGNRSDDLCIGLTILKGEIL
jgi:hypothetical protein